MSLHRVFYIAIVLVVFSFQASGQSTTQAKNFFYYLDPNGDGRVTLDEWQGYMGDFKRLDSDRNEIILLDEFLAVYKTSNDEPHDDGDYVFEEYDGSDDYVFEEYDGSDDYASEEYDDLLPEEDELLKNLQDIIAESSKSFLQQFKQKFKELDSDGDNKLSTDEWPYEGASFKLADQNGDGGLSIKEAFSIYQQGQAAKANTDTSENVTENEAEEDKKDDTRILGKFMKNRMKKQIKKQIKKRDKNGDGKVSKKETNLPGDTFDMLDTNGDGYLSEDDM